MQTDSAFFKQVTHTFAACAYRISMKRGFQAYGSAAQRLAIHLLMDATVQPPTESQPFWIDKTRQTLAEELELSVKTINRCVDTLKEDGYLTVLHRKLCIMKSHFDRMREDFL